LQLHETQVIGRAEALKPLPSIRVRTTGRIALAGRLSLIFLPALALSLGELSTL